MIQERRPATTIGELDIHLGFLMEELRAVRDQQQEMIRMLATKQDVAEQIAALNKRIDDESTSAFFKRVVVVATGIVAIAAAVGVIVAFARAFPQSGA